MKHPIYLFLLVVSTHFSALSIAENPPPTDEKPMMSDKNFTFGKRLLFTEGALFSTALPTLSGLFLIEGGLGNLENAVNGEQFKTAWTKPPVWDYDAPFYNYAVHPLMGSMLYITSRNHHGSVFESFSIAVLGTITFEFLIESFQQRPSINDLIITPILGAVVGELSFELIQKMKSDNRFSLPEKIAVTVLDPVQVIASGFSYKKICGKKYPLAY